MNFLTTIYTSFLQNLKNTPKGRILFYLIIIPLVLFGIYATDPDTGLIKDLPFGQNLTNTLLILIPVFLYYAVLHIGRKTLFDYINLGEVYKKAMENPIGAGMVFIGISLVLIALSIVILAATSGYVKLPV